MILDLGCGGIVHEGGIGVDLVGPPNTAASIICNLGFEPIPVDNDSCDVIISHHFIEHLPFTVFEKVNGSWKRYLPVVALFNDVYRVLKHGGVFKVTVPVASDMTHRIHQQSFQDPTHCSFWVHETPRYFSGDYYGFHEVYGHTSRFELIKHVIDLDWYMYFELRAIKSLKNDYPFVLKY